MLPAQKWWLDTEVSEVDVVALVNIYNDTVSRITSYKYRLKLTESFTREPWYKEVVLLYRLINRLNVKPRTYITAQIKEYSKPIKYGRAVPSISSLTSPAALKRWERYCERMGKIIDVKTKITTSDLNDYNLAQMNTLMKSFDVKDETEFFKDPYLLAQLTTDFTKTRPAFLKLVNDNYYRDTFHMTAEELLSQ